jgi:AbrB family looped-hinge helix DNA binding protein
MEPGWMESIVWAKMIRVMKEQRQKTIRVAKGGRITIPAEVRQRLGMEVGTDLVMAVEGDHATIMSAKAARRRARQLVRRYVKPGVSLSEELMVERNEEGRA